ncbi:MULTISPECIES: ABC transporter ATP-binding protein [unclassified Treponema]|uniref:ABC transporter ATP-binding protein n=1 Tax=unclassified Treponema TaxID=2638727 RepID=UPI0020A5E0F4|nr:MULTISPECIES: ABC transporter ATP-binding protein [unclassified Treponema]UTC67665.1 ABC transporter ATP-binding protein [Treponema sp. OMZ 789]UTC70393.1 ABC transporter ATP-binding protein [Treponema sp. OMZ 790]UTC73107.1 ABC transporter ATP-binding protein [Treponema sp. OMZ 791]
MLKVQNLTKYYGSNKNKIIGCKDISFELRTGEITSLLGLNGAGKSSIINCISGYYTPDEGDAFIDSYSILTENIEAKKRLGILYEQNPLYAGLSVYEFLCFAGQMHGIKKEQLDNDVNEVMNFCEIYEIKDRLIRGLSKGFKQRVGLAQAVLHNPPLIILDEPASGFDSVQVKDFEKKILHIAKEKTILICTHDLRQAAEICSNHILLNKGEIIALGNLLEIKAQLEEAGCEFDDNVNYTVLEKAFEFFAGINKNEFRKTE